MIQADLRTARQHPDYGMNGLILTAIVIAALAALSAMLHVLDGMFFMHRGVDGFMRFVSAWDIGVTFLGYLTCAAGLTRHKAFPWLYLAMAISFCLPRVLLEVQTAGVDIGLAAQAAEVSFLQRLYLLRAIAVLMVVATIYVLCSPAVRITYRQRLTRDEFRLIEQLQGVAPRLTVSGRVEPATGHAPAGGPEVLASAFPSGGSADLPMLRRRGEGMAAGVGEQSPALPNFLQASPRQARAAQDPAMPAEDGSVVEPGQVITQGAHGATNVPPQAVPPAEAAASAAMLAAETIATAHKRASGRPSAGAVAATAVQSVQPMNAASTPLPPPQPAVQSPSQAQRPDAAAAAAAVVSASQRRTGDAAWQISVSSAAPAAAAPASAAPAAAAPASAAFVATAPLSPAPPSPQTGPTQPAPTNPSPIQTPLSPAHPAAVQSPGGSVQAARDWHHVTSDEGARQQVDAAAERARLQEELEIDRRIARLRGLASGDVSALSLGLAMDRHPSATDEGDEESSAGGSQSGEGPRSTTDERLGRLRAAASVPRARSDAVRRRQEKDLSDSIPDVVHSLATGQSEAEKAPRAAATAAAGTTLAASGNFQSRIDALLSRVEASNSWRGGSLPAEPEPAVEGGPEAGMEPGEGGLAPPRSAAPAAPLPADSVQSYEHLGPAVPEQAWYDASSAEPLQRSSALPPAALPPHLIPAQEPVEQARPPATPTAVDFPASAVIQDGDPVDRRADDAVTGIPGLGADVAAGGFQAEPFPDRSEEQIGSDRSAEDRPQEPSRSATLSTAALIEAGILSAAAPPPASAGTERPVAAQEEHRVIQEESEVPRQGYQDESHPGQGVPGEVVRYNPAPAVGGDAMTRAGGSGGDPQVEQRIDAMRILVDAGFLSQEEFTRRAEALRAGSA